MTPRERNLAVGLGAVAALWGAWSGVTQYKSAISSRESAVVAAESAAADAELDELKARASLRRLAKLHDRSLPADVDVARSAYAAWLVDAVGEAGMELGDVQLAGERGRPGAYRSLSFNVDATGSLESLARLLDAYYREPVLHQLAKLQVNPVTGNAGEGNADRLRVSLTSVALVVEGAKRKEGLPDADESTTARLRLASADEYAKRLTARTPFAAYVPPPPPAPAAAEVAPAAVTARPKPPAFDDAKHAYVTGIVHTGSRLEAWINVRTTGEVLRVHASDPLKVGELDAKVVDVLPRELVIESQGAERRVSLGDPLVGS
ncbi:MAG: hypothetical protein ACRCT8_14280 [Lacipirellulaceae bacterium]